MHLNNTFRTLLATGLCIFLSAPAMATLVPIDLTTNGAGGSDLDSGPTHTVAGITITASASGGAVNATSTSLGVNAAGTSADDTDQIESAFGEDLSFVINFGPTLDVKLVSIDFVGVGPSTSDTADVEVSPNLMFSLMTGVGGFDGGSDLWTFPGIITLTDGNLIKFTAPGSYGLEAITFDVTVIPEPASMLLSVMGVLGCVGYRRR